MKASEPIATARRWGNDPQSDGRWSNFDMLDFTTNACQQLMRDILYPFCRVTWQTVPNIQAYQLPDVLEIHAVYVDGRLCIPAPDKDTLEGDQLGVWDQSGGSLDPWDPSTGGSGPPPPGNDGPSGNVGQYCPAWTIVTPAAFPTANSFAQCVWPAPQGVPYSCGQRPTFYVEGGFMGFVPTPSNGPAVINGVIQDNVDLRCVLPHEDVVDVEQALWFPISCKTTLAWHILWQMKIGDETTQSQTTADRAIQMYEKEKNQRRTDVKVYKNARALNTPRVVTGRQWQPTQIRRSSSF